MYFLLDCKGIMPVGRPLFWTYVCCAFVWGLDLLMSQSRRHDELLAREIAFSNQFFESRQSQAAHSQHPCSKDPVCPLPKNKITSHLRVETRSIDAHQNQKRPETCFCRTLPWHQQTPTEPTEAVATLNQKLQQVSERLIWIPKHWKKRAPVSMDCSNVGSSWGQSRWIAAKRQATFKKDPLEQGQDYPLKVLIMDRHSKGK